MILFLHIWEKIKEPNIRHANEYRKAYQFSLW